MAAFNWILIALVCGLIELLRAGFWFLWVAVAGLFTALGIKLGLLPGLNSQILSFTAFSFILLLFIRPLALKAIKKSGK